MEITVSSFEVPNLEAPDVSSGSLRLYASREFLDSDGVVHIGGNLGGQTGFYQDCPFTVASGTVTVASFTTTSTTDAQDNAPSTILITGQLFDSSGAYLGTLFSQWQIPNTTPTTFATLWNINRSRTLPIAPAFYITQQQMVDYVQSVLGDRDYASAEVLGITYLSDDPASGIVPIAVGDNNKRLMSGLINVAAAPFYAACDGTTNDTTAVQAALDYADSIGGGTVYFPGLCKVTSQVVVNTSGAIKTINLVGDSAVTSGILWAGATNTQAVKFNRVKFPRISQMRFYNSVSRGTTVGLWFTGPSTGEQSANIQLDNCIVYGFNHGIDAGDGTAAAGQIRLDTCYIEANNIGLYTINFNTVNVSLINSSIVNNLQYGIEALTYNLSLFGGSFTGNQIADIYLANGAIGTFLISGVRTELYSTTGYFIRGGGYHTLTVEGCLVQPADATVGALIRVSAGTVNLIGNNFVVGGDCAETIFQTVGGNATQLNAIGNGYNSVSVLFDPVDGNNGFLTYFLRGNTTWAGSIVTGKYPDESGTVLNGAKVSLSRVGAGIASTPVSPTQITSNQNNYSVTNPSLYLRLSTDASRNITGLVTMPAQVDGQTHYIINVGAQNIVLVNESASSTAANRFHNTTGADITLSADQQALCVYDSSSARWRVSKMN